MSIKISIAQMNPLVGAIEENTNKILAYAAKGSADLMITPELALTGYPPEDLLLRNDFKQAVKTGLNKLAKSLPAQLTVIVGFPHYVNDLIYNAAAVIRHGKIESIYHKCHLPNYGVFDEKRYFTEGSEPLVIEINNNKIGITICEDLWFKDVAEKNKAAGTELLVSMNASPFHYDKLKLRQKVLQERTTETQLPIIYANLVGGQDELVFDGGSFFINADGKMQQCGQFFQEELISLQWNGKKLISENSVSIPSIEKQLYQALVIGTKDYVTKNKFPGVIIGVSGGIDSALTLCVAVDALGADNVHAVLMPSRYTADMSNQDALALIQHLGVKKVSTISIESTYQAFLHSLEKDFAGLKQDTTEENLQARCRGVLLMALSNKTGKLVLITGNKSEMAVGYSTLYGDMAGGFAVLKDVSKHWVYQLSLYRNQLTPAIPERIITRPPSAELALDQKDEDSLPPYPILDKILELYIEKDASLSEIIDAGFAKEIVEKIIRLVNRNEYKRRQAPPGIRVTTRALSRDRRYPITSGF